MDMPDRPDSSRRARLDAEARRLAALIRTQHGAWTGRGRQWRPTRRGLLFAALLLLPLLLFSWERCGIAGCPSVEVLVSYQPGGAPVLLDRAGEQFAELAPFDRVVVAVDSLPEHVLEAFIAVEDRRFHEHNGVDVRRVFGALVADIKARGFVQGSSTITMQVARNVFPERLPGQQKTLRRKILEVRVARELERRYTKPEILELYLNHIYFGGGAYGIEAASRYYFGRAASRLTLEQAAVLAALPRSPTFYNPRRNPEASRERRDLVLTLMEQQDRIDEAEAQAARASRIRLAAEPPRGRRSEPGVAPYFVDAVRRDLEARFGDELYSSALRVHTTLDRAAQRAAEQELERKLREIERGAHGRYAGERYSAASTQDAAGTAYVQGAVVIMDAHDGDVLALVGGRDFEHSRFNRAVQARRQVGSAFKPFVFAAALERGYAPSQHVADEPLTMELPGGEIWEPRNFTNTFDGEVTLRDALVRSRNVPTVRVANSIGMRRVVRIARDAGVYSDIAELPSTALGTSALSPLEITAAYTAFANGGERVDPRWVKRIEDADGRTVWEPKPRRRRALTPEVAFLVTDMLGEAIERGTATQVRRAGFRGPAAGKTGTTDNGADVWFIGYTPQLVAGVWIGFDAPQAVTSNASAGDIAAPLWGRMMQRVTGDAPAAWPVPDRIVEFDVDPETGLVLADGCRPRQGQAQSEYFVRGDVPARICPRGEERDRGPGIFARIGSLARNVWHTSTTRVAALFRRDSDDEPVLAEQERTLGAPRLPRAAEVRRPEIDTSEYRPRLLGTPWEPDTVAVFEPDTMPPRDLPDTIIIMTDSALIREMLRVRPGPGGVVPPPGRGSTPPGRGGTPPARDPDPRDGR
jgi:penicillin-binding protein 1A